MMPISASPVPIRPMTLANGKALNYLVPSKNQCASCHATNHTTGELLPIGMKARHLDRSTAVYSKNQLEHWAERGWLTNVSYEHTPNAIWGDTSQSLDHQARSYLDINCGHCHNAQGAADTSGLLLDYEDHPASALGPVQAAYCRGSRVRRASVQHRSRPSRRFDFELSFGHQRSGYDDAGAGAIIGASRGSGDHQSVD